MIARFDGTCFYGGKGCLHGGVIKAGKHDISWNRKVKGMIYHTDCFEKFGATPRPTPATPATAATIATSGLEDPFYVPEPTPAAPTPATADLFSLLATQLTPYLDSRLAGKVDESTVRSIVKEMVAERNTKHIVVTGTDGVKRDVGVTHKSFEKLLYYVSKRRSVYMWGPMGTGKSHAAEQAAKALGLQYAYVSLNPQSMASLLAGFIDATGTYRETDFFRCYRDGGVFCIDELDNASPSLLTTLNSALANAWASFPCGMVPKHKDFVLVATGNTSGRGGDWQYPERRKIDEATLDRLTFLYWDADRDLELSIADSINPAAKVWVEWVWKVRDYVADKANGIRGGVYATGRAIMAGAGDWDSDLTVAEIADTVVFKGLDPDTKKRILNAVPLPQK